MIGSHLLFLFILLPTASADQVRGRPGSRERLHLRGVVQADARQVGHRGHRQPADGPVEPADGSHQGDDGRPQGGQRGHQPEAQVLGPAEERPVQGRHRPGTKRRISDGSAVEGLINTVLPHNFKRTNMI